jgi:hypothetical protein
MRLAQARRRQPWARASLTLLFLSGCTDYLHLPGNTQAASSPDGKSSSDAGSRDRRSGDLRHAADACGEEYRYLPFERNVPELIVALDLSMRNAAAPSGSLLQAAQQSLRELLPAYQGAIQVGYAPFPSGPTCSRGTCCAAPPSISPALGTAAAIDSQMRCELAGACRTSSDQSPSFAVLRRCREFYDAENTSAPRFVLLLTDHDPLCDGEPSGCDDAVSEAARLAVLGVKTIVLGLGAGSEHTDCMEKIAVAGLWDSRRPKFARDTATLKSYLKSVFDGISGHLCRIAIKSTRTFSAERVVITFDDAIVPRDPERLLGWEFDAGSDTRISVFGEWCDSLLRSQVKDVDVGATCSLCGGPYACR